MSNPYTENDPNDPYADRTKRKPTTEKLQRIRAKCVELLKHDFRADTSYEAGNTITHAMANSTIAAIDSIFRREDYVCRESEEIIAAWERIA